MTMSASAATQRTSRSGPASLAGRNVVVMGLGRFGGGVGVSRWLAQQGARVTVTDLAPADELAESVAALDGLPIRLRLGGHSSADLEHCDLLVVNPAVDKPGSKFFADAERRGVRWTTENNLFLERCPATVVGITGSVGKSTTTAMIGAIVEAASRTSEWNRGRVWVGGNIGRSLLPALADMSAEDVVVLELSSFQLDDVTLIERSPAIAVLTNLRPNHLDRHGSMDAYAAAKRKVFAFQRPGDTAILPPASLLSGYSFDTVAGVRRLEYSCDQSGRAFWREDVSHGSSTPEPIRLRIPGPHNRWNAAAALAVSDALEIPFRTSLPALGTFPGLPHRVEFVCEHNGVRYFNDSKATTPDAAMTAMESFDEPLILICGGYDKKISLAEWGRRMAQRCRAVICFGQTREAIFAAIRAGVLAGERPDVCITDTLDTAVSAASSLARAGDVVILSPGCASYDQFKNYEERGERFRRLVSGLA